MTAVGNYLECLGKLYQQAAAQMREATDGYALGCQVRMATLEEVGTGLAKVTGEHCPDWSALAEAQLEEVR